MQDNKLSVAIPAGVATDVIQLIHDAILKLAPYTVALSQEERHELPKMGQKTIGFVNKVTDYSTLNPSFVPPYMDAFALKIDTDNYNEINPAHMAAEQLATILSDILLLSGSEAYVTSLQYYNNVKLNDHNNVASAKSIYNDLKERFPGKKKGNNPPTP